MDTPQSLCYIISVWTLTKLTLPSVWEKPYLLGIQVPIFSVVVFCLFFSFSSVFLYPFARFFFSTWPCNVGTAQFNLRSFSFLIVHSLLKSTHSLSMLRALKCVQLPRHFSNLKSHSNTGFASLLRHHKHICLELNSWSFLPCWKSCIFLSRSTLTRRLTWLTKAIGSLACGFHLGLATGKP